MGLIFWMSGSNCGSAVCARKTLKDRSSKTATSIFFSIVVPYMSGMQWQAARILPQIDAESALQYMMTAMTPLTAYFLQTDRLGFRQWASDDLPLAQAIWGNPDVTRFVGGPFCLEQVQGKLDHEITNLKAHNVQYWPMFLLSTGEHAGCAGLRPPRPRLTRFYIV